MSGSKTLLITRCYCIRGYGTYSIYEEFSEVQENAPNLGSAHILTGSNVEPPLREGGGVCAPAERTPPPPIVKKYDHCLFHEMVEVLTN